MREAGNCLGVSCQWLTPPLQAYNLPIVPKLKFDNLEIESRFGWEFHSFAAALQARYLASASIHTLRP